MATYRIVITGASSGIGRATALLAAKHGHSLFLIARNQDRLEKVAQECKDGGARYVVYDLYDISKSTRAIAKMHDVAGGGEIVLVNNAGCAQFGEFHEMPIEKSIEQVEVMLNGTMRMAHTLLPMMLEQKKGTIVNVLSIAATHTFASAEAYSSAKAGALAFSKCLAMSYKDQGVRVIALIVGATDTPLWDDKDWSPPKEDMLTSDQVATKIIEAIEQQNGGEYQEIVLLPPKGIL